MPSHLPKVPGYQVGYQLGLCGHHPLLCAACWYSLFDHDDAACKTSACKSSCSLWLSPCVLHVQGQQCALWRDCCNAHIHSMLCGVLLHCPGRWRSVRRRRRLCSVQAWTPSQTDPTHPHHRRVQASPAWTTAVTIQWCGGGWRQLCRGKALCLAGYTSTA